MNLISEKEITAAKQRLGIVGQSPALTEAIGRALRVAPIDLSVLVIGESGSGKEFFPKIIHGYGSRKHAPYIAVNCGAIPEGTIDSELFGHEKGAFTGAVTSRKGYFEEANGGTIFLDEVAELPLTTQARLLRVLETGEFIRVGSSQVQKSNVRIVAATNVDMAGAVAAGRFREDLYYRLSTVQINVPPLRDRANDILLLAKKFAADFAEKYSTPELQLTPSAKNLMLGYRWPGNVRQLKNVVEQLSLFEASEEVGREILSAYLPDAIYSPALVNHTAAAPDGYARERDMLFNLIFTLRQEVDELRARLDNKPKELPLLPHRADSAADFTPFVEASPKTIEANEREMIRESLERNGGRRKATADELNISERTLYRKIREYGLE